MPIIIGCIYLLLFDKTFRNLFYYRIGKYKYLIEFFAKPHGSFVIGTNTKIGKSMLCVHPIGSIINAKEIGENFVIRNNTVIGKAKGGLPIIGDNVSIGVNSVVIGGIHIGNNVKIGAGTIITKSIPENCIVVGNPAYILKQDGLRVNIQL